MIFLLCLSLASGKCIISNCESDGVCDRECNEKRCLYDFGDCGQCSEGCLLDMIADGKCDVACFNEACSFDGFDCTDNCNELCQEMYIGDGICDEECNNQSCKFDGGDCDTKCAEKCLQFFLGDLYCDEDCFNIRCSFDYGDCDFDIYVSPGSSGSGSEFDPFGTIKEAFDSVTDIFVFYNIHLSPGIHYIDTEISLINHLISIRILGDNSEVRIVNLTSAFNFTNILALEASQVTFDGTEFWETGCESNTCRFVYNWKCEEVCSSWNGEEIPDNDTSTLRFWNNCVERDPLSIFSLSNIKSVKISEINVKNFGLLGSLINATGCSIEASDISISDSEVFNGIIFSADDSAGSYWKVSHKALSYMSYMKAVGQYLIVSNLSVRNVNMFNNPFKQNPCLLWSNFAVVKAVGINNLTLSNLAFTEIGSNNFWDSGKSSLILLQNCINFVVNSVHLSNSSFIGLSLVTVRNIPNYFFLNKGTSLIQSIKIDNVFTTFPLISLNSTFQNTEIVIKDVEISNSSLFTNLINAMVLVSTPKETEFIAMAIDVFKLVTFDKYIYVDNVQAYNLYLKDNLLHFNNTNYVQLSNYSISHISDGVLEQHRELVEAYLYLGKVSAADSVNFLSFKTANVVKLLNGSISESNTNSTAINFDSQIGWHQVDGLNMSETEIVQGLGVVNGTLSKVSLTNLLFTSMFFSVSGIYSDLVSNIEIMNSLFTNMKSVAVKLKADSLTISNSKFQSSNSQAPLVYIMPLFFQSSASLTGCEFVNNTGFSPIDTYIDSGKSEMTVLFQDSIFSGSFGTSPISFAFSPNSEVNSITFENCTITGIVSNNCNLYLDHGALDISLNKGKAVFTGSRFVSNSCTQSTSPVVFHNNENSDKIHFVNCEMLGNNNDIFFLQNNILVKQRSEFDGCVYSGNKAKLITLRNSDSLFSNFKFIRNAVEDNLISVYEESSLAIEHSGFVGNVSPGKGVMIKVSAANGFHCKDLELLENLYYNTYLFDLSSTNSSLVNIRSEKNSVYNLITSTLNTLVMRNFTSNADESSTFLFSVNSILSVQACQFTNQKLLFEFVDNEIVMDSVILSGIDEQVFMLKRSSMISYNLSIKDSAGLIAGESSDVDFKYFDISNSSSPVFESSSMAYSQSSFFSTQGLVCENSELVISSTSFESCNYALNLRNSKLKMKDSRIAYSKNSAILAVSSDLQVNTTEFLENQGESGGGLYLDSSSLSLFHCNLTKNSALDGGAIFYSHSTITEENNVYTNNSAVHGDNKATPFSHITEDPSNNYNFTSGDKATNLKFYLQDELDQTIKTDNSSIISLSSNSSSLAIKGSEKFISTKGEISLEGLIINAVPGSTENLALFHETLTDSLNFNLSFRECVLGEILEADNSCNLCENNTYSIDKSDLYCKPCPFGAVCRGGHNIFPAAGYWASSEYPENLYPCLNPLACNQGSNDAESNCAFSYDGTLCATCIPGYKLKGSYNCTKCPKYWVSWLIVVISGILILGFVAFMVYFNIKNLNKSKSEIALLLKILVNYCQTIVVLATIDLKWPSSILNLFDFSTAIGESSTQVLSLTCTEFKSDTKTSYVETLTTLLFPLIVILAVFLVWGLVSVTKKTFRYIRVHFISTCVVVILLMHTSVSNTILSVFSCKKVNGEYWNTTDYNLKCFVGPHLVSLLYVGLPGLVIWCISLPVAMFISLFKHRRLLEEVDTLVKFKTLFAGYKPEFYYWEFLVILRKFLIRVIAILLISSGITIQGLGIMVVLIFSLSIHINYKPYEKDSINKLEQYCIIVLILFISGGIVFSTNIQDQPKIVIGWVLFVVNIMFLMYWAKFFFKQIFDILGKTKLYRTFKNRLFFRKKNKIEVNIDQGAKIECTYKSGAEEPADRSLDLLFPKNPSNSYLGADEFQPKCNVWTVKCEDN